MGGSPTTLPTQDIMQRLKAVFQNLSASLMKPGAGPAAGVVSPGRVGGPPQALASPPPIPGLPGLGAPGSALPSTGGHTPVASSAAQMQQPSFVPSSPGTMGEVGFNFPTRSAAHAATAYSIMEDLKNVADRVEKRDFQRKSSEAEYLMHEYWDARQRGDLETANAIAGDPKFKKILKEFQGYSPFEITQNEKPPAVAGIEKAAQKIASKTPSESNKINVRPQTSAITQEQLDALRSKILGRDPNKAEAAVTGTTLSGEQLHKAEEYGAGLATSPQMQAQMNMEQRKLDIETTQRIADRNLEWQVELRRSDMQEKIAKLNALSDVKRAEVMAGPAYARVKEYAQFLKAKSDIMDAKKGGDVAKTMTAELNYHRAAISNLQNNLTSLVKADQGDSADAEKIRGDITEHQRMANQIEATIPNPTVDLFNKLMNDKPASAYTTE